LPGLVKVRNSIVLGDGSRVLVINQDASFPSSKSTRHL
jgi:hypothetical protein